MNSIDAMKEAREALATSVTQYAEDAIKVQRAIAKLNDAIAEQKATPIVMRCRTCGAWTDAPPIPPGMRLVPDWQPIETAPKDGTELILFHPSEIYEGQQIPARITCGQWVEWTETCSEYHAATGVYLGQSIQGGGAMWTSLDGGFREESPPTHWMPLPAAPEPAK